MHIIVPGLLCASFQIAFIESFQSLLSHSYHVWGRGYSEGLHDLGGLRWQLCAALAAAWVLIYIALFAGIKSSGKVSPHLFCYSRL